MQFVSVAANLRSSIREDWELTRRFYKRERIVHLVNRASSRALGYISQYWRWAKVTFIPKVGKKDGTM